MRTVAWLLVGVLSFDVCAAPSLAIAESVAPGTRIRLTGDWPGARRQIGSFLIHERDSIWIRKTLVANPVSRRSIARDEVAPETTRVGVRETDVRRLEISRGMQGDHGRSVLIGTLGGVAFGALLGTLSYTRDAEPFYSRGLAATGGAIAFGLLGLVFGTIVSLGSAKEKWEPVPITSLHGLTTAPADSTP